MQRGDTTGSLFVAKGGMLSLRRARQAACNGDVDHALPALLSYADAGDQTAAASAAELLAYLDRWRELIPLAGAFVANPFATYAGNVFDDMVRLLARAATETGDWALVANMAREARVMIEDALDRNTRNLAQVAVESLRARLTGILDHLSAAADRRDAAACAEPIRIFGIVSPVSRREDFDAALSMKINRTPERRLSLAMVFGQEEEALRYYAQLTESPSFDTVLFVARVMSRSGATEDAARAIELHWSNWFPVDTAQVAPVAPLTDVLLSPLMSATRCKMLIRRPRAASGGREA